MLYNFPYSGLSADECYSKFYINNDKTKLSDDMSAHKLKVILTKGSKNNMFSLIDCNYCTCDEFNRKTLVIGNHVELGVLHIDMRTAQPILEANKLLSIY